MIRLGVAIMSHPSRAERVSQLLTHFDGKADVHVEVDHAELGPWPTARKCWESCPEDATHMLILQDDVRVCRDFYVGAIRALRHRPDSPIAFYANHKAIEVARNSGLSWARIPRSHGLGGVWGQAQCIPARFISPFLHWWDSKPENGYEEYDNPKYDDWILGQFLKKNKKDVWATVPSLVQHDCPSDSLIGYSNKDKVARWYIGDDESALKIDWRVKK